MTRSEPVHIEYCSDESGEWTEEWWTDLPPEDAEFRVVRGEWSDDMTTHRIYEIEIVAPE